MPVDPATVLRSAGLRVTRQRVAVMSALAQWPHASADVVLARVHDEVGRVSTQAVYDVLHTLADRGLVRRIQPAGSPARFELRVRDNHHHAVCRSCGEVTDIDCATGAVPCLEPGDLDRLAPGFAIDEAEVTYWGLCAACSAAPACDDLASGLSPGDH